MSLKAFHVFFVVISTLLALGFGVWSVSEYSRTGQGGTLAMGVASFLAAVALVVYGFWFLRKLKNVSYL
jgi:flagellar biogenesis protein FliO